MGHTLALLRVFGCVKKRRRAAVPSFSKRQISCPSHARLASRQPSAQKRRNVEDIAVLRSCYPPFDRLLYVACTMLEKGLCSTLHSRRRRTELRDTRSQRWRRAAPSSGSGSK